MVYLILAHLQRARKSISKQERERDLFNRIQEIIKYYNNSLWMLKSGLSPPKKKKNHGGMYETFLCHVLEQEYYNIK